MAIRIRTVDGIVVALCAAKTQPEEDDIYLDDSAHHALSTKFGVDWYAEGEGFLANDLADEKVKSKMLEIESKASAEGDRPEGLPVSHFPTHN